MNKTLIIESCEKRINEDFSNTSIVHVRNSMILAKAKLFISIYRVDQCGL